MPHIYPFCQVASDKSFTETIAKYQNFIWGTDLDDKSKQDIKELMLC